MTAPTYEVMLEQAKLRLASILSSDVSEYSAHARTVRLHTIADLERHISWLERKVAIETGAPTRTLIRFGRSL